MAWLDSAKRGGSWKLAVVAVPMLLVAAACGDDSDDSSDNGGGAAESSAPTAVTVKAQETSDSGVVLADDGGNTLYFADEETTNDVRCVNSCLEIWEPVEVADGVTPSAGTGFNGEGLNVFERPDGTRQLALDDKPLYRFALEEGPGRVGADNLPDEFEGVSFVWHAARPEGEAGPPAPVPAPGGATDPGGDSGDPPFDY